MSLSSALRSACRAALRPLRRFGGKLVGRHQRALAETTKPQQLDNDDEGQRFSTAWHRKLYEDLGDGTKCFRPAEEPNYGGGFFKSCLCCQPNTYLHLLPNEESALADVVNDNDFRLIDHPTLAHRKTIVCSKLGMCNGRKPFVCRTHPVYFAKGNMLFEESLCRLSAVTYLNTHRESVEHIRSMVYRHQLEDEVLGYGRNITTKDGLIHGDFEH